MKITAIDAWAEPLPLTQPYTIAFATISAADIVFVRVKTDGGIVGMGAGTPFPLVTGETVEDAMAALAPERVEWLVGREVGEALGLARLLEQSERPASSTVKAAPAGQAALDIALHDVWAKLLGLPLARALGQVHEALPTSVTIGIMDGPASVDAARAYLSQGFRVLKVKTGHSVEEDVERLHLIRAAVGNAVAIRVDANQGYAPQDVARFFKAIQPLDIEFVEQPVPPEGLPDLPMVTDSQRRLIAADESLMHAEDCLHLVAPARLCGIFNIKLMKCGGIAPARRIATFAELAGIDLMWGCMDESVISISAALHAAFASPATKYLDLDGSFDLARDLAAGGFVLEEGMMRVTDAPGLGTRWL